MAKLRELRETNSQSLIRNTTKEQPNNVDNLEIGELNNSKSVEQNTRSFADEQTRVNSEGMSAKVANPMKFDEVKMIPVMTAGCLLVQITIQQKSDA